MEGHLIGMGKRCVGSFGGKAWGKGKLGRLGIDGKELYLKLTEMRMGGCGRGSSDSG
jgi:hypothetical protein